MKRKVLLFILGIITGLSPVSAQQINPLLVGTNVWYYPTSDHWQTVGELGNVGMIRIGGNAPNKTFPSNSQLMQWVKDIRSVGGEPLIQISQFQSTAEAAAVVEYFNITQTETAPIKYWNIGNEPILDLGLDADDIAVAAETVVEYFKPLAEAMKEVDPSIKIFGPDYCYYISGGFNKLLAADGSSTDLSGKIPGKDYYYLDGIAWHKYPQISTGMDYEGYEQFKSDIEKAVALIEQANAAQNRTGDQAILWGIGEYNAKGGEQVHTWENGQMFGGVLGLFMKHEATYACTWSIFEHSGDRTGTDFGMIDGTGYPRATYYHMQMVASNFSGNYIDGTSSDDDVIVFGCEDNGKACVMIINRKDYEPVFYSLNLNGADATNERAQFTLNAGIDRNINGLINPDVTQLIVIENGIITKTEYSKSDFENEIAPNVEIYTEPTTAPDIPIDLVAQATSYNTIDLTWCTTNENTTQSIMIYRKASDEAEFSLIGSVNGSTTFYNDYSLLPETSYHYQIKALNAFGYSDFSAISSATTDKAPTPEAYNGPHKIPGIIQIEDFNMGGEGLAYHDYEAENKGGQYRTDEGVDIENCTDTNGGFNIGYVNDGEWLKYLIESIEEGTYNIYVRFASNSTDTDPKSIELKLAETFIGSVTPYNTGGWQAWETLSLEDIEIHSSEKQLLTVTLKGSGFNINYIDFVNTNSGIKLSPKEARELVHLTYNASLKTITAQVDKSINKGNMVVYDITGQTVYSKHLQATNNQTHDISVTKPGIYIVSVYNEQLICNQKISVN